jgi:hypothetical protein
MAVIWPVRQCGVGRATRHKVTIKYPTRGCYEASAILTKCSLLNLHCATGCLSLEAITLYSLAQV